MDKACVVTTNFNGREKGFLDRFLETLNINILRMNKNDIDLRIIVVDDGSTDTSLETLKRFRDNHEAQVDIRHTKNLDGNPSLMHGIRYALSQYGDCNYVITFDVDTCLSEDFLRKIIKKAQDSRIKIGMFASNEFLLTYYPIARIHRSKGHYMNARGATFDLDFLDKSSSKNKVRLCHCFSGALLRTKMLLNVELVPDKYLHYNNCSEFGLRAQLNGWKVEFAEQAIMWHNYRRDITNEQKEQREISRIWNIHRFFPKEKIESALDAYRNEDFKTSPRRNLKEIYIQKAEACCPRVLPSISEKKKRGVYRKLIAING